MKERAAAISYDLEGEFWTATLLLPHLNRTVRLALVRKSMMRTDAARQAFIAIVQGTVADAIGELTGKEVAELVVGPVQHQAHRQ